MCKWKSAEYTWEEMSSEGKTSFTLENQRSVAKCLFFKGHSATKIHGRLVKTSGKEAIAERSVQYQNASKTKTDVLKNSKGVTRCWNLKRTTTHFRNGKTFHEGTSLHLGLFWHHGCNAVYIYIYNRDTANTGVESRWSSLFLCIDSLRPSVERVWRSKAR